MQLVFSIPGKSKHGYLLWEAEVKMIFSIKNQKTIQKVNVYEKISPCIFFGFYPHPPMVLVSSLPPVLNSGI